MQAKNRTADILYGQMVIADETEVSRTTLAILNLLQTLKVSNQLLGLACAMVCLLESYELTSCDVLGIAHNIIHQPSNNNANKDFKAIKQFIKSEWEIILNK